MLPAGDALHPSSARPRVQLRLEDCFHPGDVVVAEVCSLGDARSYFLSTMGPHLGVVCPGDDDGVVRRKFAVARAAS